MREFDAYELMQRRVKARTGRRPLVSYSAYKNDAAGEPIDNLDDVASEGKVKIVHPGDDFFGNGTPYESAVLESPTWLDLCEVADEQIRKTRDVHHVFLEGMEIVETVGEVKIARLWMGS